MGFGEIVKTLQADFRNFVSSLDSFRRLYDFDKNARSTEVAAVAERVVELEEADGGFVTTEELDAALSGAGATAFVFRPDGVAAGNVYTSFALLMAACDLVEGPRTILFDDSLLSPCEIPVGAWNMEEVTWLGKSASGSGVFIEVLEGATFTLLRSIGPGLGISGTLTTPAVADLDNFEIFRITGSSLYGGGPFIQVAPNKSVTLELHDGAGIGGQAVDVVAAGSLEVRAFAMSTVSSGAISGEAEANLTLDLVASSAVVSEDHPDFLGTLSTGTTRIRAIPRYEVPSVITAGIVLQYANQLVSCDTSGGTLYVQLPLMSFTDGGMRGQFITIKKVTGDSTPITLNATGGETIDGVTGTPAFTFSEPYGSVTLVSDGVSNWMIVGRYVGV